MIQGCKDGLDCVLPDFCEQFVIAQLHSALAFPHEQDVKIGGFSTSDTILNDMLWVKLVTTPFVATAYRAPFVLRYHNKAVPSARSLAEQRYLRIIFNFGSL